MTRSAYPSNQLVAYAFQKVLRERSECVQNFLMLDALFFLFLILIRTCNDAGAATVSAPWLILTAPLRLAPSLSARIPCQPAQHQTPNKHINYINYSAFNLLMVGGGYWCVLGGSLQVVL